MDETKCSLILTDMMAAYPSYDRRIRDIQTNIQRQKDNLKAMEVALKQISNKREGMEVLMSLLKERELMVIKASMMNPKEKKDEIAKQLRMGIKQYDALHASAVAKMLSALRLVDGGDQDTNHMSRTGKSDTQGKT